MFLTLIINYSMYFVAWVVDKLPGIPNVPDNITNTIDTVLNVISTHIHLLNLFVPLPLLLVLLPISIAISQASLVWSIVLWVYRHIPIFGKGD